MIKFDSIIILCIILVLIIIYLYRREKRPDEHFNVKKDFDDPSFFTTEPKTLDNPNYSNPVAPPFLRCYNCKMNYDCSDYAYDYNDTYMSVCRVCKNEIVPFINTPNNVNNKVLGKSPGRPSQCGVLH